MTKNTITVEKDVAVPMRDGVVMRNSAPERKRPLRVQATRNCSVGRVTGGSRSRSAHHYMLQ